MAWLFFALLATAAGSPGSGGEMSSQKPSPPAASRPASRPSPSGGSDQRLHRQVVVTLLNGEKVKGLIRGGMGSEKPGGLTGFVPAKAAEKNSGIRLFYVFGTNSYLFLPKEIIKQQETVGFLSDLEVRELDLKAEEEAAKHRAEMDERLALIKELQKRQAEDHDLVAKLRDLAQLEEEAAAQRAQEAAWQELLQRFAPEAGWTPERLVQIRQRIVNDVFPSAEEREFVKAFEEWKKAFEARQAGRLPAPASRPATNEAPGTASRPTYR